MEQTEEVFAYSQKKLSRNTQIQTRLHEIHERFDFEGLCKGIKISCEDWKMLRRPRKIHRKICLVFNLTADFHGTSINKALLSGPGLTNQIGGGLLRFRKEQIAVTGDVKVMYHQVQVPGNQSCFIWFLWWMNSDSSKVFVDHEMTAHEFGGASSPFCPNYALKKTAADDVKK